MYQYWYLEADVHLIFMPSDCCSRTHLHTDCTWQPKRCTRYIQSWSQNGNADLLGWRHHKGIMESMGHKGVREIWNKFMPRTQLTAAHQGPNTNQPSQDSTPCIFFAKHRKQQIFGYLPVSEHNQYMGKGTTGISKGHQLMVEYEYSHRIIGMQHWSLQD